MSKQKGKAGPSVCSLVQPDDYLQKQTESPTRGMLPGRGPGWGRGWRFTVFPFVLFRIRKKKQESIGTGERGAVWVPRWKRNTS